MWDEKGPSGAQADGISAPGRFPDSPKKMEEALQCLRNTHGKGEWTCIAIIYIIITMLPSSVTHDQPKALHTSRALKKIAAAVEDSKAQEWLHRGVDVTTGRRSIS